MKFDRLLIVFVIFSVCLFSCSKSETEQIYIKAVSESPEIVENGMLVSYDKSTSKFVFETNGNWTLALYIDADDNNTIDWCSVDKKSGTPGTNTISFTFLSNTTYSDRTAKVVLSAGDKSISFNILQEKYNEYSKRPCYVVIDNATRVDATLASAMNAAYTGVFCLIQKTMSNGAAYYHCTNNQGLSSDILWTPVDQRMTIIIGENNGIFIGYGNLETPSVFYAYDRECPNCFEPDAVPVISKPLSMNEKGHATCDVCKRVYDMNNHGYIISGEQGFPLTRYPATTSGPYGTLTVQ